MNMNYIYLIIDINIYRGVYFWFFSMFFCNKKYLMETLFNTFIIILGLGLTVFWYPAAYIIYYIQQWRKKEH